MGLFHGRCFGVRLQPSLRGVQGPGAKRHHLSRMSFLTDFTPLIPRASSVALLISDWELTKPLNCTTPLECFDIDLSHFQGIVTHDCRFDLGGDDRIVDILSGPLLFLRGGTAQENGQQDD